MHQALEEDRKTHKTQKPKTPAYFFTTLDYTRVQQFFRNNVLQVSNFIEKGIKEYQSIRGGNLELNDFKERFLDEGTLQETVFYFVFAIYRLKKLIVEK